LKKKRALNCHLQSAIPPFPNFSGCKDGFMQTLLERNNRQYPVSVPAGSVILKGNLGIPEAALGVVLFADGNGSSRYSLCNQQIAQVMRRARLATLLINLLTLQEEAIDLRTRHYFRFNINFLAQRLVSVTDWLMHQAATQALKIGYFGVSTGSAAALVAAAERPDAVGAVVSCGKRPDLTQSQGCAIPTPTLLIMGEKDTPAIAWKVPTQLEGETQIKIIPSTTHLLEEPGALETVGRLASQWFERYL
jgi:putative phosphoribosyl transferase